jgi:hypothetical protein
MSGVQRRSPQPFQKLPILVEYINVFRQGFNVSNSMHKSIVHVAANRSRCLRNKQHAATAATFQGYKRTSFLNGGQDQDIILPHKFGHIVPMPKHVDAGVRQQGSQLFSIPGYEFASYGKDPVSMRLRAQPCLQGVV